MTEDREKGDDYYYGRYLSTPPDGEDIVISGIAGMFPDSHNIHHFRDNLYNKVDMVNGDTRRWSHTHPEIPHRSGKIYDIEKFDAGFFGVHKRQADAMDPMTRHFMERAVEAIIDAGYHPEDLAGTRTGVFVGACFSESEKSWFFEKSSPKAGAITGVQRSMIPNRISYLLKLKGPSYIQDTACSSSLYALDKAFEALRDGNCDMAIVGGVNLCLHPFTTLQFARLGVLSMDGTCKVFDDKGDGYVRSETIAAIFLEKSKNSKRIYSRVVHVKTNCDGFKTQSITFPSGDAQRALLEEFYEECQVNPNDLSFLEAHGTGTFVGDPEELTAIDKVLCAQRTKPLLVGSVKSNIGHTEPSSGLCSLAKVIIGMENGVIPPNLHFSEPRKGVECLEKGRLEVVTENTPFRDDRGLIAINSFGFGGGNAHVLLKWNEKLKVNGGVPSDDLPRLVCVSGRVEDSISSILDDFKGKKLDAEYVGLYHNIFRRSVNGHIFRGYGILSKRGEISRSWQFYPQTPTPVYFVFTEITNDLTSIIKEFYQIPLFTESLQRIDTILKPQGVNISEILTGPPSQTKSILATLVLQVALVDIFKALEINISGVFGEDQNQFICAYQQGTLNLEQTVLGYYKVAKSPTNQSNSSTIYALSHLSNISTRSLIIHPGTTTLNTKSNILSFNSFVSFLETLGTLYENGHNPQIQLLYPAVQFPVSRGTPMISSLIKWDHNYDWFVTFYETEAILQTGERSVRLALMDVTWKFIAGHVIDGRNLFPATGYLHLAWEALALITGVIPSDMKVVFENVQFKRATSIRNETKIEMTVMVQRGSGLFEVVEGGAPIVTGCIKQFKPDSNEQIELPIPAQLPQNDVLPLTTKDIYKELHLRGYNYQAMFKGVEECDGFATRAVIRWEKNWIPFMDNLLQIKILQVDTRNLYVPTGIKRLSIDAQRHLRYVQTLGKEPMLPVYVHSKADIISCGGIEVRGLTASSINQRKPLGEPVLEKYQFVPNQGKVKLEDSVRAFTQLILENSESTKIKCVELIDEATPEDSEPLSPIINEVLGDLPLIQASLTIITNREMEYRNVTVEDKKLLTETDSTLVIGTNLLERNKVLNQAFQAIKENAFVLSRESLDLTPKPLEGIDIVIVHSTPVENLYLIRKPPTLSTPTVIDVSSSEDLTWLSTIQSAIKANSSLLIFSQNNGLNGILGLVNCLRREQSHTQIQAVFIVDKAPPFDSSLPFYSTQLQKGLAINVYKDGSWGTYRHLVLPVTKVEREQSYCNALMCGDLSSLKWIEGPLTCDSVIRSEQILISTYICALNFRDVMTASGRISFEMIALHRILQELLHGFEYAGRTSDGKRVMGMTAGALSTLIMADQSFVFPVPDGWTLAEGATIPVIYCTVLSAFFINCCIKKGQSILIHAGSGGVGQAAINICLFYGLTVYTTVGTQEKRAFLKKKYPQLTDQHIGNSRDTSFETLINKQTHGRGVDYVLNSLAEEKLLASVRCLAHGGNFLEIGKFDLLSNHSLNLLLIEREITFHGVMLDSLFNLEPRFKRTLRKLVLKGLGNGSIKPLDSTIFQMEEVEQAFRYMAAGKHIGKVVIQIREEEEGKKILPPPRKLFKTRRRFFCNAEKVHIILGGLGGFGLELADWLILRGARNMVLTSRKGVTTGYQGMRIRAWKTYGTRIQISTADITTKEGCEQLIVESQKMGEIESIFNLAVVLKDGLFENQTIENFVESLKPKAWATVFLDELTRKKCKDLRDFVIFSSVSCGRGNAGQTNYGMANSIMERVCEKRREDGLPALAIEWGAVGDVGLVAQMQEEHTQLEIGGTLQQRISSCLNVLDQLLAHDGAIASSMVVAEKRATGGANNMVDAVANILGISDLKLVSLNASLSEIGMDSMTAVEIKQTLEREYEVFLTPQDIRGLTFARLLEIQEERTNVEEIVKDQTFNGFEMMFRLLNDEETAKLSVVQLASKIERSTAAPRLIIFPGIEGVAKLLDRLAMNLNSQVYCFQYPMQSEETTIEGMAKSLFDEAENLISSSNEPFYILGYSYGSYYAMEVAKQLEEKGYNGNVIIVDGAPELFHRMIRTMYDVGSDAIFETSFLTQLLAVHMPIEEVTKHWERLSVASNFEDRLNIATEIFPKDVAYSIDYLRDCATATYRRLKAINPYQAAFKLKSPLTLCKAQESSLNDISEDYGLSTLCEHFNAQTFKGTHVSILENIELANCINKIIELGGIEESTILRKEKLLDNVVDNVKITAEDIKQI